MFLERTFGHGNNRPYAYSGSHLRKAFGWFFTDFRYPVSSGSAASNTKIEMPYGQGYQLPDSSTGFIPHWQGDCTRLSAAQNSGSYYTIPVDINNSESEFFWICRARTIPGGSIHPISRGRDGAGSGWSILSYGSGDGGEMAVITTTGSGAGFYAATATGMGSMQNVWHTYMGAYKSGSYVKFGVDGIWRATTSFVSTGLRSSSQGLSIGRFNNANATAECDIRFVGLGLAVPTDSELMAIHNDILELERDAGFGSFGLLAASGGGASGLGSGGRNKVIMF